MVVTLEHTVQISSSHSLGWHSAQWANVLRAERTCGIGIMRINLDPDHVGIHSQTEKVYVPSLFSIVPCFQLSIWQN